MWFYSYSFSRGLCMSEFLFSIASFGLIYLPSNWTDEAVGDGSVSLWDRAILSLLANRLE